MSEITLVSHVLCPYVQRAAIALEEKGVPYQRLYVDLSAKPDWFKAVSPLGKVPLLIIRKGADTAVLFESAAILEYLEETEANPLHPADPMERARHRGWIEFGSAVLNRIARLYNAPAQTTFREEQKALRSAFERLEAELKESGAAPFFAGEAFTLVDAVFAPVFRYFDVFEDHAGLHVLDGLPGIAAWRRALAARPSVVAAVQRDYPERLADFLRDRNTCISQLLGIEKPFTSAGGASTGSPDWQTPCPADGS